MKEKMAKKPSTQRQKNTSQKTKKNVNYKRNTKNYTKRETLKKPLRIIPLGGLGEIGKNITLYEYDGDMFLVDCGMSFPDEDMPVAVIFKSW